MAWNYRIMKRVHEMGTETEVEYGLYEVYYTKEGKTNGWTKELAKPASDDLPGMAWLVEKYQEALTKPVLDYETGEVVSE